MSTAKNSLIGLLALTTVAGVALGWYQYKELVELRAAALTAGERADLQKKIWDLQKANRELTDELAAAQSRSAGPGNEFAGDDAERPASANPREGRGLRGRGQAAAMFRQAMQKPEVQALMSSMQKAAIDSRYAALFRSMNLTPEQSQKLSNLLVERQNAERDVFAAAREQGVNPRTDPDGFNKLMQDAQSSINDSIKSVIGDSGLSQLQAYDQTMPQRNLVNVLQQHLTSAETPLTSVQADQLVQILAANSPSTAGNATRGWPGRGMGFGGGMDGGGGGMGGIGALTSVPITAQAVAQAGTVLTPPQLAALQQLQQQQQNAQQLQQVIRSTWQQMNNGQTGGGNSTPPAGGSRGPG